MSDQQVVAAGSAVANTTERHDGARHLLAAQRALLHPRPPAHPRHRGGHGGQGRQPQPGQGVHQHRPVDQLHDLGAAAAPGPGPLARPELRADGDHEPGQRLGVPSPSHPGPCRSRRPPSTPTSAASMRAAQQNAQFWGAMAPGVAMPPQLDGASISDHESPLNVEIDSTKGAPSQVVLRETVTLSGGSDPGHYTETVVLPVHGLCGDDRKLDLQLSHGARGRVRWRTVRVAGHTRSRDEEPGRGTAEEDRIHMSFDEMYDEMLHGEFSSHGKHQAKAAAVGPEPAEGAARARHAAAEEAVTRRGRRAAPRLPALPHGRPGRRRRHGLRGSRSLPRRTGRLLHDLARGGTPGGLAHHHPGPPAGPGGQPRGPLASSAVGRRHVRRGGGRLLQGFGLPDRGHRPVHDPHLRAPRRTSLSSACPACRARPPGQADGTARRRRHGRHRQRRRRLRRRRHERRAPAVPPARATSA